MEQNQIKENLKCQNTWIRGVYLLIFAVIGDISGLLLAAIVVFQFLSKLITGNTNDQLLLFSKNLCRYIYQICLFLTFLSDEKPFPFGEWPKTENDEI